MVLDERLADRTTWSATGNCPIEKTIGVAGTRSALLVMREASYGTTRFDDFCHRVGITRAATAARLNELVDVGLLTRRPYQEPGRRRRDEYVLTPAGEDFLPVVFAMFEWGSRHLPDPPPLTLTHAGCGADAHVTIRCDKGHDVTPGDVLVRLTRRGTPGPGASARGTATPR